MAICGIYTITSPSGNVYVGQSVDVKNRWQSYKKLTCVGQPGLYNSLKKYGPENHVFEMFKQYPTTVSKEILNVDEINAELFFKNKGVELLNARGCGWSGRISDAAKKKISLAHIGKKMHPRLLAIITGNKFCVGRHMSEETRAKIGNANKGKGAAPMKQKN